MNCIVLTAFLLLQGSVLSWRAPTMGVDGKPLRDLAGFMVYRGEASGHYTHQLDVGLVESLDLKRVSNLELGVRYFFAVTAYDTAGNESDLSDEVSTVLEHGRGEPVERLFVIYPNPFDAFITIETGRREGVVKVFNLLGNLVDLIYATSSGVTHDTSRLPSGIYLFKFKGQTIKRLLVR